MSLKRRHSGSLTAVGATQALLALAVCGAAGAVPQYLPPGSNLTFGEVTHSERIMSAENNPAAPATVVAAGREAANGPVPGGVAGNLSVGLEYGNMQELFDTIDELARRYRPTKPGEGGGGPGQGPGEKPPGGIDIGDIIDTHFPELRPALEQAAREVATQLSVLGIIATEGYARASVSVEVPFLLGTDILGGTWAFRLGASGTATTVGVADRIIDFDLEAALKDLEQQIRDALGDLSLEPGLPPVTFDVVGDVDFTIDPTTNGIRAILDNDSLLLSKAARINEISVGYSRSVIDGRNGQLFVGAEGRFYDLSLSRISVRFGDITDSEELFKAIRNAKSRNDSGFGIDLGAIWVGPRYQVGGTLANVNEPTFHYPRVPLTPYRAPRIIRTLVDDEIYTMERQLKVEGSVFTEDRRWAVSFGLDANAVRDPVGDEFQWATASAAWTTRKRWVPNLRLGYRRNLAGTEIRYLSAGIRIFRFFDFDVASALDTVSIRGDELPRGLMMNMGFSVDF